VQRDDGCAIRIAEFRITELAAVGTAVDQRVTIDVAALIQSSGENIQGDNTPLTAAAQW